MPMDNETIQDFETITQKFIMENLPPIDIYTVEITSVVVVGNSYGPLQKQMRMDTIQRIASNIIGDVLPGNPPDTFSFSDAVGHGFETNFSGFKNLLRESSSFFREHLPPTGIEDTDPQDNGSSSNVTSAAIYVAIAAAAVGVLLIAFVIWKKTTRPRSRSVMSESQIWSAESIDSILSSVDSPADNRSGNAGDSVAVQTSSEGPGPEDDRIKMDASGFLGDIGRPSSSYVERETELGEKNTKGIETMVTRTGSRVFWRNTNV